MARKTSDTFDMAASNEAAADERKRMNAALAAGAVVYVNTFLGTYRLLSVTNEWWYATISLDGRTNRAWAGCNDGDWADMMAQAGIPRNPRWARFERLAHPLPVL